MAKSPLGTTRNTGKFISKINWRNVIELLWSNAELSISGHGVSGI